MQNKTDKYVIGVDGGATKTLAALANLQGKILKIQRGGPINWHNVGQEQAKINLKKLLKNFLWFDSTHHKKKGEIYCIVFGLSGLDTRDDFIIYKKIIKHILPSGVKFRLYNDTKIALEALPESEEKPRLIIVSGTGSNVYGEYRKNQAKAGGWGFLLSDEGSAYWFGIKTIKSVVRFYDGRGPKTILSQLIIQKEKVRDIPNLVTKIYEIWDEKPQEFEKYIASFAPIVNEAYQKRDKVAKVLIEGGAEELFIATRAVIKKLRVKNQPIWIGLVGSTFKISLLKRLLVSKIKKEFPGVYFVENVKPVEGAIKLAIEAIRDPLSANLAENGSL